MELLVDGKIRPLLALDSFRTTHNLPDDFSITQFVTADVPYNRFWYNENNQFDGLHDRLKNVVPRYIDMQNITEIPQLVATVFEHDLVGLGIDMGLTRDEVEIAATDFRNVLESAVYKLVELYYLNQGEMQSIKAKFDIEAIYREVLNGTVLLSMQSYSYIHGDSDWDVYPFHTNFGPTGMCIEQAGGDTFYVEDLAAAFPAFELIHELVSIVGQEICDVFARV